MRKFEYLLLNTNTGFFSGFNYQQLNEHLNQLGAQGWEVVATVGIDAESSRTVGLLVTLKRELPAA